MGIVPVACLAAARGWRRRGYDDVHLEPDQLGREIGQPVVLILRKSIVDDNVLPFKPPELAQPLPERLDEMWGSGGRAASEIAYVVDLPRRLRPSDRQSGQK